MMPFLRINNITGWLIFSVALLVYGLTAQATASFWDSGEFIASGYKLQVTHPPGAPLYTLLTRIFLAMAPASAVAWFSNMFSALCGAFTILFLFWSITLLARKVVSAAELTGASGIAVLASGVTGSLALTFAHSYWVASTEAEVYTLSTLLIAAMFWAALIWDSRTDRRDADRWLVLVAFLMGLSGGVHIMNLAAIFPVSLLVTIRRFGFGWKQVLGAFAAGVVLFIFSYNGLVLGLLKLGVWLEILLVNSFGMPFNSGLVFLMCLLAMILAGLLYLSYTKNQITLNTILLGVSFFLLGWTAYGMVIIRASADTPIANSGSDPVRLLGYMQSDQYAYVDRPLIKGRFFASPLDPVNTFIHSDPVFMADPDKEAYVMTNDGRYTVPVYDKKFDILFPRIYHNDPTNVKGYNDWVKIVGKPVRHEAKGKKEIIQKPTFWENFDFFLTYQLGWLNYRYFMWNFAGRQNDNLGVGGIADGNWISGINVFDSMRTGPGNMISDRAKSDRSRNPLYFLPLILGLVGCFFLYRYSLPALTVIALFFLAFSVAITIFINQLPIHILIRERDYIFLGAYFAFCMPVGLSVLGLFRMVFPQSRSGALGISALCLLAGPVLMAATGWNDHNRSRDRFPVKLAKAYLDACEPNALLITTGDNTTFPMWYLQEVEGYRTDVRIINYEFLNFDWYIDRLKTRVNDSDPVNISIARSKYVKGTDPLLPLIDKLEKNKFAPVDQMIEYITDDQNKTTWNARKIKFFPATRFQLAADTARLRRKKGLHPERFQAEFTRKVQWVYEKEFYSIADMIILDILQENRWERPVYFTNLGREVRHHQIGLQDYLLRQGLLLRLLPLVPAEGRLNKLMVDTDVTYDQLMHKLPFDEFSDPSQFVRSENRNIAKSVLRPEFYFLAQALTEEGKYNNALEVVNACVSMMPDTVIAYKEYMFSIGKLLYRLNRPEGGRKIISKVIRNIAGEISLAVSFVPRHGYIQAQRTQLALNMYNQILEQLKDIDSDLMRQSRPAYRRLQQQHQDWLKRLDL